MDISALDVPAGAWVLAHSRFPPLAHDNLIDPATGARVIVSTVQVEHGLSRQNAHPDTYETRIFGGAHDGRTWRCREPHDGRALSVARQGDLRDEAKEEARAWHAEAVALVNAAAPP